MWITQVRIESNRDANETTNIVETTFNYFCIVVIVSAMLVDWIKSSLAGRTVFRIRTGVHGADHARLETRKIAKTTG